MAIAAVIISGCSVSHAPVQSTNRPAEDSLVERIRISAITEFVPNPAVSEGVQIKTLVELFDASNSPVKASCMLRFEFYEFYSVSSDPRGPRLFIWPDQDLSKPDMNNKHWKDLLRGYEFFLPLELPLEKDKKYILEVTCQVDQQRYNDLFKMQYQP